MNQAIIWWIQFVDIPALAGIVWWMLRHQSADTAARAKISDALTSFRIEVAKEYVSVNQLKDALQPLTERLGNIDDKIDKIWKNGR